MKCLGKFSSLYKREYACEICKRVICHFRWVIFWGFFDRGIRHYISINVIGMSCGIRRSYPYKFKVADIPCFFQQLALRSGKRIFIAGFHSSHWKFCEYSLCSVPILSKYKYLFLMVYNNHVCPMRIFEYVVRRDFFPFFCDACICSYSDPSVF